MMDFLRNTLGRTAPQYLPLHTDGMDKVREDVIDRSLAGLGFGNRETVREFWRVYSVHAEICVWMISFPRKRCGVPGLGCAQGM